MATDIDGVLKNIRAFADPRGKSVIHVGAGGGQLVGYGQDARSVLCVDSDPEAIATLKEAVRDAGLEDHYRVVQCAFESLEETADMVFFEFCLHEMDDPARALRHARTLADEIVVLDHVPESPWSWYTCEERKAELSWDAVCRFGIHRAISFKTTQNFKSYPQLALKVLPLGGQAIERIGGLSGQRNIKIDMKYALALLRGRAA